MDGYFALVLLVVALPLFNARVVPHIIGGRDARPGEFPHQGSLQRLRSRTPTDTFTGHLCGCVLVSDTWVVTAAHCVGTGPSGLYVVMGLHKRGDASLGAPVGYYIQDIISHPDWDQSTLTNDIAMIKLSSKVQMNNFVKPIDMAPKGANYDGQTCTISGWGVTSMGGGGSPALILQAADVKVMPQAQCSDFWVYLESTHICVGVPFEKGACNGDSGGPLVCQNKLAGVTSFGQSGCYVDVPSVYTRISEYRDWIKQISGL